MRDLEFGGRERGRDVNKEAERREGEGEGEGDAYQTLT